MPCCFLDDAFFVDDECEFAAELFGGFAAEDHAFEEDLEVIHNGANRFVELQRCLDEMFVDFDDALLDGEVDAVVLVEGRCIFIAHTGLTHVGLISDDDGRGDSVDWVGIRFVMVANGGDDSGDIFRLHAHVIENTHCHKRACLRMVMTIDDVADVVHIASNARDFNVMLRIVQIFEDLSSH